MKRLLTPNFTFDSMYHLEHMIFLVADTQLYKSLCPSIRPSVRPSVRRCQRVEKWKNAHFRPRPPIRNWWPCIRPCFSPYLVETWYEVFKWKNATYAHYSSCQTSLPPNQPTSLKVKNVHILSDFQPIWLKFGMESLNGRTQHMYLIYLCLSMLTGQTDLPPNQLTSLKIKNLHKLDIFVRDGISFRRGL